MTETPTRTPVIIDCDPGHDDALAITLALARPELQVLGITTIGGNSTLANTTRNALRVLALLGRPDVPVAAGPDQPLVRPLETAPQVHGVSGLDGADLPEPVSEPRPEGALEFLRATLDRVADARDADPRGAAHEHRAAAADLPGDRREDRAHLPDGRSDGGRQLDPGGRVQHLGGPRGGPDRVPQRPPDHDAWPGRDPQGADGPGRRPTGSTRSVPG